ncbi:DUF805 domain-containing protein [Lewinella sp. W8]|uniref:DUF805 domain-containing protein n=1 Tax=Lewinella sp. W8 TaxID=2528208 RepID=UPI001068C478|nr:DUF805 domain-containing protein [Lewinella sp. W8]
MEYFKLALSKYAQFTGRSRRSEYWYFFLVNLVVGWALQGLGIATDIGLLAGLAGLWSLAMLIPGIAVGVRRLHDTGRSGWWLLIALVPLIGAILLIVWFATDSAPGSNEYGPNPKTGATDDVAAHLVD